jgi:protein gp37
MGDQSAIAWTQKTWNPWQGCHKVSPGCKHCYMYREKRQYGQDPTVVVRSQPHTFNRPLHWPEPALVFTCSWSDWFIEEAHAWRDDAWSIIRRTPHLTYQILTKRPERIPGRLPWGDGEPWPNVWLGISAEDQRRLDLRWMYLERVRAARYWISYEPALGAINFTRCLPHRPGGCGHVSASWIVVGGESGSPRRELDLTLVTSTVSQCRAAGVAVFVKQDSGPRAGQQERIPAALWIREWPR